MRIKKYVVDNLSEAMQAIKQDLGQQAVILDTKKVRKKGFLGLFGHKTQIEVVAAVDHTGEHTWGKRRGRSSASPAGSDRMRDSSILQAAKDVAPGGPQKINQELQELKQLMLVLMDQNSDALPQSLREISQRLQRHDLLPELRAQLLQKLLTLDRGTEEIGEAELKRELINLLRDFPLGESGSIPRLTCFVGPTGVGKTTTIAKLAADVALTRRMKVGLITADTYRIAAVEQLKTYAQILNVPVEVVYSKADLTEALDKLSFCDAIFIDTAGRNYLETEYIRDVQQWIPEGEDMRLYLVLSLTSKFEDMLAVYENFKSMSPHALILTKSDETQTLGSLINFVYHSRLPLAYVTTGQNVPDDILVPTPEWIADLFVGKGSKDAGSS